MLFQRWDKAQSIHFFQEFFKISVLMSISFFLKIKVIVTEFMAHDFPKNLQTKFIINLGIKIQMPILGEKSPTCRSQTRIPLGLMRERPTKVFEGNRLNVLS
uniref:Uncharacterized protein n=1 Tax=Salmonella enterica subsp. enterica serovar Saintpaul TaxID=90105 RepID=A0A1S0ZDW5_SALET